MKNQYCQFCGTVLPEDGVCLRCGAKYELADDGQMKVIPKKIKTVSVKAAKKQRFAINMAIDPSEAETQTIPISNEIYSFSDSRKKEEKHADWTDAPKNSFDRNNIVRDYSTEDSRYSNNYSQAKTPNNEIHQAMDYQNHMTSSGRLSAKSLYWIVFIIATILAAIITFTFFDRTKDSVRNDTPLFQSKTQFADSKKASSLLPQMKYEVMPYVINLQVEEARKLLEEKGFVVDEYVFHTSFKNEYWGLVRFATLRAGEKYPRGKHVTLEVWSNQKMDSHTTLFYDDEKTTVVPDLVGKDYASLKDNLKTNYPLLSFKLEEVRANDNSKKGMIIGQFPSSGNVVVEGSQVVLRVSKGAPSIAVPDVKLMPEDEATQLLLSKGLKVKKEYVENNNPDWNGLVQGYGANELMYEGEEIKLYICKSARTSE